MILLKKQVLSFVKIKDIGKVVTGKTPSQDNLGDWGTEIPFITPTDISENSIFCKPARNLSVEGKNRFKNLLIPKNSICFTCIASIGKSCITTEVSLTNQQINSIVVDKNKADYRYIFYVLKFLTPTLISTAGGTMTSIINKTNFEDFEIPFFGLPDQKEIADILGGFDNKIELLQKENKTLEKIAQTIFKEWFVDFRFPGATSKIADSESGQIPEGWSTERLGGICNISIGRTPPRKEEEWFSRNKKDVKWISIRDLGISGIYIFDTVEYLTREAVDEFNVPIIPENTVIISFKLTVGRVAITTEKMLSNEAIAHLKSPKVPFEFLYLSMKNFDFDSLGSTSSIASAVNSQSIKGIEIVIPDEQTMNLFNLTISPIFRKVEVNLKEINNLSLTRDELLNKFFN